MRIHRIITFSSIYHFHPATNELFFRLMMRSFPIGPFPFPPSYSCAQPTVLKLHQTRRNPSEVMKSDSCISKSCKSKQEVKVILIYFNTNWTRYNMAYGEMKKSVGKHHGDNFSASWPRGQGASPCSFHSMIIEHQFLGQICKLSVHR